jgi:hypothetical protein
MVRISSQWTFFYKWIFPLIWFGFLAVIVVAPFVVATKRPAPTFLIMPAIMAFVGYAIMKRMIFGLVDDVFDAGDALVVKNRDQEERIALSDIINVNYSQFQSPARITLSLRRPSVFGDQISFFAPMRLNPFSADPTAEKLIRRIDAKRKSTWS